MHNPLRPSLDSPLLLPFAAGYGTLCGTVMEIVRTAAELRPYRSGSLVPTMGALHDGHIALIRRATSLTPPVILSIFVNPTQFAPGEDFTRYPRTFDQDCHKAELAGANVVFAPSSDDIYPPDEDIRIPNLPAVATEPNLEDAFRPSHFAGVCQVVARLFDLIRPIHAIFGEKDYQQLLVIRALVKQEGDRWEDLTIHGHPTVRASDGLAISSRNSYLTHEQHERALGIYKALRAAEVAPTPADAEQAMREVLHQHRLAVDYAAARDARTLMPIETFEQPARALVAAHLDDVRLIDNMAIHRDDD